MSNQNQPLTVNIAKVVFESIQYDRALEADRTELSALLQSLPTEDELNLEAAINAYENSVREIAFLAGWQLAKQ